MKQLQHRSDNPLAFSVNVKLWVLHLVIKQEIKLPAQFLFHPFTQELFNNLLTFHHLSVGVDIFTSNLCLQASAWTNLRYNMNAERQDQSEHTWTNWVVFLDA